MYSCKIGITSSVQRKYVSDTQGLVGFAIGLVNSVFNLPDGKGMFFEEFENRRTVKLILVIKKLLGLVEMMTGLVNASFRLPKRQAVKIIFFAPCTRYQLVVLINVTSI